MSVNLADKAGIPINRIVDDGEVSCMDNTNHAVRVNVVAGGGGGGGGTSAVDEAAFVEGTTSYTPVGGEFQDAGTALTAGQGGVVRLTANRAEHVNLRNAAGTEIGTLSNAIRTDPVGTTTQPVNLAQVAGGTTASPATGVLTVAAVGPPTLNVGQVSITSTATQILASNTSRIRLIIVMPGTVDVWLGGSGVTTTTGQLLAGTKGNQIGIRSTAAVYGIVASTSQTITYAEETY